MAIGIGETLAVASAATWAVGMILARQLGSSVPPAALNLLKNALVLVVLAPWVLNTPWPGLAAADVSLIVVSGVLGIAVADTLYFRALNQLGAGRMGVIGALYSPLMLALGFVFLDERLSLTQWLGFGLVGLGVLQVAQPVGATPGHSGQRVQAVVTGMLAIALMAAAILMIKRILELQPLLWVTLLRLAGAVAGLLSLAVWPRMRASFAFSPRRVPWAKLIMAALIGQGLSMLFWLGGYKYASASVAAVLNESASVFLVLLAWLWLREPLGRRAIIGILITFSGIACMLVGRAI